MDVTEQAVVDQRGEPRPDSTQLELLEDTFGLLAIPSPQGQLVDMDIEGNVTDQWNQLGIGTHPLDVVGQVLSELG